MLFERLLSIVPLARINPEPAEITEEVAAATLAAFQALWHPAILSRSATLPVWARAGDPPIAGSGQLILVPDACRALLPSSWLQQAESSGARVIIGTGTRSQLLGLLMAALPSDSGRTAAPAEADGFYAAGLARLYLDMLTAYMSHTSTLDEDHLRKEVLAAAAAAMVADLVTRDDHLRAAFQLITEARERLYGADIHLLDLCLVDPNAGLDRLGEQLRCEQPVNIFASGRTVEQLQTRSPTVAAELRKRLDDATAELVGGEYEEVESPLLPLESQLWQFRRGDLSYHNVLGRSPAVFGRRRFGLSRTLLQLLGKQEVMYLTHFCFDGGIFPMKSDPRARLEAPDSSTVEAIARIPFAADNAAEFLKLPWRLSRTIATDFSAMLALAHWPSPETPWYGDLLYMSRFANVFGKFTTLSHYLQAAESPAISSSISSDDYASPFLIQAHARGSPRPISFCAQHHRARARIEQIRWLEAVSETLSGRAAAETNERISGLEDSLEQEPTISPDRLLDAESAAAMRLADVIGPARAGTEPGTLLFNSLTFDRLIQAPVAEPSEAPPAADRPSVRQITVSVPAGGFAWVPRAAPAATAGTPANVEDHTIRNEFLEVEIEAATGGIRSVRDRSNRLPQLGQQLVLVGTVPSGRDGESAPSVRAEMQATSLSAPDSGPELACCVVDGNLIAKAGSGWAPGTVVARFRHTFRLMRGDRVLRVGVEISDLAGDSMDSRADPWRSYLASRVAWPDPRSVLVRGVGALAESTRSPRPESPYFIEIHGRKQRIAVLTGGLPHHQRVGTRMLDTLLITATEQSRQFEFGIAVDVANPFQSALDLVTPPAMIARNGPPPGGPVGWFFHLDTRNVVITSIGPLSAGRCGVRIRLFESAGRYTNARLRCPRNVAEARLTDFRSQRLATLDVQGDTVVLDLAPREITQLEIEFSVA